MKTDWEALRTAIEGALKGELNQLIDGSIASLDGPLREASNRLAIAIRKGAAGAPLVEEIRDQIYVEIIRQKLVAKQSAAGALDLVIGTGLNLLFQGAIGALGSIRQN